MRADVEKLLDDRRTQGLPRTIEDPAALRRIAAAVAGPPRAQPKDAA